MSNGTNQFERLWRIQATVNKLVLDGQRDPEVLANILQAFKDGSVHATFGKPRWRVQGSVIYLTVVSDGRTGAHWISGLEKQGSRLSPDVKAMLLSPNFKPTTGTVYEVAVLKSTFFEEDHRTNSKIREESSKCKFLKPNAEVACLIRENFSDKEIYAMGLTWIVVMHEPINDCKNRPCLLAPHRMSGGFNFDSCIEVGPEDMWNDDDGFAFLVSEKPMA